MWGGKDCLLAEKLPYPTFPTPALVSLLFLDPRVVLMDWIVHQADPVVPESKQEEEWEGTEFHMKRIFK